MEYGVLKKMKKFELIEMILQEEKFKCLNKNNVLSHIRKMSMDYTQENFILLCLSADNSILKSKILFKGATDRATIDLKILFREILSTKCLTSIIIAHNHPSGNMIPSDKDKKLTNQIKENSKMFGIKFYDHLIFDRVNYFSFLEENLLEQQI